MWFASLLTGQSNEDDYTYIGFVKADQATLIAGRKGNAEHPAFKAIAWFLHQLALTGEIPIDAEFWHEGRCCRCGRTLTVPTSIASGIGPECASRM